MHGHRFSTHRPHVWRSIVFLLLSLLVAPVHAALTPVAPWQAALLPEPNPPAFAYSSAIAYHDGSIFYAGDDGKIYAYDIASGASSLVCDTSALATAFSSVQGFLVASDGYLYFHDNATTAKIYRLRLADPWPVEEYAELDTEVPGAIYAFAENPWTGTIWFSSADFFGSGNTFYLHEVNPGFGGVRLRVSFVQPNGGGNGPMLFIGPSTVLYGESVFGGNGFFHLLNANTGEMLEENYLTVAGGLADAALGYNRTVFATSGGGKRVLQISGATAVEIAASGEEARGLQFNGETFYVSEMVPFGQPEEGQVLLHSLKDPTAVSAISAENPFFAGLLAAPSRAAFAYSSSIAYHDGSIFYAGDDGKIYAYDIASGASSLVCDTSALATAFSSVQGFLVASDGYLYFHDNATTAKIYRLRLADPWPVEEYAELDTEVPGAIYAFAENPWTGTIWFSSADFFGAGDRFYLHQVNPGFNGVTLKASFAQPHGGGNGPLVFLDATTVLYGESVFGGDGYFHKVNTQSGALLQADSFTFEGGLAGATRAFDGRIYVATGGGKTIFALNGESKTQVAETRNNAQDMAFDGASLLISGLVPFGGGPDAGSVEFLYLGKPRASGVPAGQQVSADVDLNADGTPDIRQPEVILAVNAAGGSTKQIGVGAVSAEAVIDALEAVDPATISDTTGRPASLPFGLIRLRVSVPSGEEAQVRVYLSEPAPAGSKWYKYDPIAGWQDYSAYATFSADRKSVALRLKDGDYGDADRIVNGEVLDPGGIGAPAAEGSSGGGGGGCFIAAVAPEASSSVGFSFPGAVAVLLAAGLAWRWLRRRSEPMPDSR